MNKEIVIKIKGILKEIPTVVITESFKKIKGKKWKIYIEKIENYEIQTPKVITKEYNERSVKEATTKLGDTVTSFVNILENNIRRKNLKNLYENILSLDIKEENNIEMYKHLLRLKTMGIAARGKYNPLTNSVIMINFNLYGEELKKKMTEQTNKYYLNHELLHMSSSVTGRKNKIANEGIMFSGFYQSINKYIKIGYGINEGYTEALNCKYFGTGYPQSVYEYEFLVARAIEEVVGKETMISLYFNADLKGLMYELSKYCEAEEERQFIISLDIITESLTNPLITNENIIYENDRIIKFISKIYMKKIEILTKTEKITEAETKNILNGLKLRINTISRKINSRLRNEETNQHKR